MERLTLAKVNRALKAAGFNVKVVRGRGYHYVVGAGTEGWPSTSILAFRVSHLSLPEWISAVRALKEAADA